MHKNKILIVLALLVGFAVTGFQCSSSELTSAKLYISQKKFDKALESLQKELEKNPQSDEGLYYLGVVKGELKDYPGMIDAYSKSLAISDKFKAQINDSKIVYWANSFNEGVGLYQSATKAGEDSSKLLYDKSIASFKNAIAIQPDSADAYRNLAFVYLSRGENDAAIEPLEQLIKRNKDAEGFRFLGEVLYNKGNELKATDSVQAQQYFDRAITVLEEGRKSNPNDSDILVLLSNSYIAADRIEVATEAFKAGIIAEPENKYYRYNYGVLLLGANKYAEAEEQFKKAVEIDPEYDNAIYNLAVTYVRWGSAISKEAEDKGVTTTEHKAKYELALPYIEKVVEKKPEEAPVWELLGRVYTILGQPDKATNAFNNADKYRK